MYGICDKFVSSHRKHQDLHDMSTYDFDKVIDRRDTQSYKWDALQRVYGRTDLLPMWVADMDWPTPPFITEAIRQQLDHTPVLGYTLDPQDYWPTVMQWIKDHHQWNVEREWLSYIPGIVKGIGLVVDHFLKADEKVIVQPPVYHPFFLTSRGVGREVVWNPLIEVKDGNVEGGTKGSFYRMDFEGLEKVCDEKCRILILANPHNPAGITWDKETLQKLAHFAKAHHLIVISDEIHCDLALYGHKHIPFSTVSDEAAEVSITFSAPTKTFNMAGVVSSWCIIPNKQLREDFYSWLEATEMCEANMFAPVATVAALKQGEAWRKEMLSYVEGNIDFVIDYCKENIPQIHPIRPEASYLVWLDCRALGVKHEELVRIFEDKAQLALNSGAMFGPGGEGFMRLNVGCPRATIKEAMERLQKALA